MSAGRTHLLGDGVVLGEEKLADTGVLAGEGGDVLLDDFPGDLGHQTDAVTGETIGGAGAAVQHAADGVQGLLEGLVAPDTLKVGDEANLHDRPSDGIHSRL